MSDESPRDSSYEAISLGVDLLDRRRVWERENRIALLWVHAEVAITVGLLMVSYGTASTFVDLWGDLGARLMTGVPPIIGGLVLSGGLVTRPRRIPVEIVGLITIALWDLGMSIGFLHALWSSPSEALPYLAVIFAGYLQLLVVHAWTLWLHHRRAL